MENFRIQEILRYFSFLFFFFFFTKKILEADKVIVQDLEQISVGNIEYCLRPNFRTSYQQYLDEFVL